MEKLASARFNNKYHNHDSGPVQMSCAKLDVCVVDVGELHRSALGIRERIKLVDASVVYLG